MIDAWFCKINFDFIYPTQLKFERSSLKLKTITEIEVRIMAKKLTRVKEVIVLSRHMQLPPMPKYRLP
jgi:hypothetical protein